MRVGRERLELIFCALSGAAYAALLGQFVWPLIRKHSPLIPWLIHNLKSYAESFTTIQAAALPLDIIVSAALWTPLIYLVVRFSQFSARRNTLVVTFGAVIFYAFYTYSILEFVPAWIKEEFYAGLIFSVPAVVFGPICAYLIIRLAQRVSAPNNSLQARRP